MKVWMIIVLLVFASCKTSHNPYKEEKEDNFNLKQSKEIVNTNKKNRKANERYARKRQQKIQESNNVKNKRVSKTKAPEKERGIVP